MLDPLGPLVSLAWYWSTIPTIGRMPSKSCPLGDPQRQFTSSEDNDVVVSPHGRKIVVTVRSTA